MNLPDSFNLQISIDEPQLEPITLIVAHLILKLFLKMHLNNSNPYLIVFC